MGNSIYQDIAERTKGSVYIGVIGPVRTGKSYQTVYGYHCHSEYGRRF